MAEKMGVSRETIIHWETGKRKMRPAYLCLFCSITGFTTDDIVLPEVSSLNEREQEK